MIAEAEAVEVNYLELIEKSPDNSTLTLHNIGWEEYEKLLQAVDKAPNLRIAYEAVTHSLAFPVLTDEVLAKLLAQSQSDGQDETLSAFEEWLRAQQS